MKKRKAKPTPKRKTYAQRISDMVDRQVRDIQTIEAMQFESARGALALRTAAEQLAAHPGVDRLVALLNYQATALERFAPVTNAEELPY